MKHENHALTMIYHRSFRNRKIAFRCKQEPEVLRMNYLSKYRISPINRSRFIDTVDDKATTTCILGIFPCRFYSFTKHVIVIIRIHIFNRWYIIHDTKNRSLKHVNVLPKIFNRITCLNLLQTCIPVLITTTTCSSMP